MLERIVGVAGGENEQLGIEPLERLLELFLPSATCTTTSTESPSSTSSSPGRTMRASPAEPAASQDRQAGRSANRVDVVVGEERLRPVGLGLTRLLRTRPRRRSARSRRPRRWLGSDVWGRSRVRNITDRGYGLRRARARRDRPSPRGAAQPSRCRPRARRSSGPPARTSSPAEDGSDRIVARAGDDRISAEYDGGIDRISCGPGRDVVAADARDRVDGDCEVVSTPPPPRPAVERATASTSRRSSRTPTPSGPPRSRSSRTAGTARAAPRASRFSTSKDGGRTWREGILPGLTLDLGAARDGDAGERSDRRL